MWSSKNSENTPFLLGSFFGTAVKELSYFEFVPTVSVIFYELVVNEFITIIGQRPLLRKERFPNGMTDDLRSWRLSAAPDRRRKETSCNLSEFNMLAVSL